jgi:hypothetical protein
MINYLFRFTKIQLEVPCFTSTVLDEIMGPVFLVFNRLPLKMGCAITYNHLIIQGTKLIKQEREMNLSSDFLHHFEPINFNIW